MTLLVMNGMRCNNAKNRAKVDGIMKKKKLK